MVQHPVEVRQYCKYVLAELAAVILLLVTAACARERTHPNVLLITLDTFRADRLGARTPALAALASQGVRFDSADSPVPLTLPAHSTLLSGLLPLHHGMRNNGAGAFPVERDTLATLFARSGYRTGAFVGSFILDHRFGLARGFDRYDDDIQRGADESSGSFEAERRGGEVIDRALAWLKQNDARPFFAWVHLYDAHAPYAPPPPYPQSYDGEVAYVDAQVARLLAAVDRKHTIIVVVGDHGESLGEHGELTHGLLLYEPTLHVPLIIVAPSLDPRVVREPVSTVDVAPTIARLAGLSFGEHDLLSNPSKGIYAETEYPATLGWHALSSMRSGDAKLIAGATAELFDLRSDPGESVNRLGTDRRTFRALSAQLDALRATAVAARSNAVDEETRRKLASLGYVAPGGGGASEGARDPRAMAPLFRRYEEAVGLINAGRAREAVAPLHDLVHDDPSNHVFRETLARAMRQSGEPLLAIMLYREAVALAPNDADAWYNLASALQEAGYAREAETAIAEAARRDPNRPELHNLNGVALAQRGDLPAAEGEFRKVTEADPHNGRGWSNLGNVLRDTGRPDDALAAYEKAIAAGPRNADALNGIGVVLTQKNRAQDALRYFDAALEIAPDLYEAQLNRAVALTEAGDRRAAVVTLQNLLARIPKITETERTRNAAQTLLSQISPNFRR